MVEGKKINSIVALHTKTCLSHSHVISWEHILDLLHSKIFIFSLLRLKNTCFKVNIFLNYLHTTLPSHVSTYILHNTIFFSILNFGYLCPLMALESFSATIWKYSGAADFIKDSVSDIFKWILKKRRVVAGDPAVTKHA